MPDQNKAYISKNCNEGREGERRKECREGGRQGRREGKLGEGR